MDTVNWSFVIGWTLGLSVGIFVGMCICHERSLRRRIANWLNTDARGQA